MITKNMKTNFNSKNKSKHSRNSRYYNNPRTPTVGNVTVPTECNVIVNLFSCVKMPKALYVYNVKFEPDLHRLKIDNVFNRCMSEYKIRALYAFDGLSTLIAKEPFPLYEFLIPLGNNSKNNNDEKSSGGQLMKIDLRKIVDISNRPEEIMEYISAIDTIIKFYHRSNFCIKKNRIYDIYAPAVQDLKGFGAQIISGVLSTFKSFGDRFFLNLDITYGLFYISKPLVELACMMYDEVNRKIGTTGNTLPQPTDNFWRKFAIIVVNTRLVTTHRNGRNMVICGGGIVSENATERTFNVSPGVELSVADYFEKTYFKLKYPHLPLICVKKKSGCIYIPMEVLVVQNRQRYKGIMNEYITTAIINAAACRPDVRFKHINEKAVQTAMLHNPVLSEFGLAFDGKMFNCKGVILPPPKIVFKDVSGTRKKNVSVVNGGWTLKDVSAITRCESLTRWKIFLFYHNSADRQRSEEKIRKAIDMGGALEIARRFGVNISQNYTFQALQNVSEYQEARKEKFNLVVLADTSSHNYSTIKRISEIIEGVITQCILAKNLDKLLMPNFMGNLLLKINVKLGGANWILENSIFADKRTILIGIDVNHPGIGDDRSPSIACVVGSINYEFNTYHPVLIQQQRNREFVDELKEAFREIMVIHREQTNHKPERIIVFRDGVGDSMFDEVLRIELNSIRECLQELEPGYNAELNFIIAQKRHSIRFSSNNLNLAPGTVVDGLSDKVTNNNIKTNTVNTSMGISSNELKNTFEKNKSNFNSATDPIYDFYLTSHTAIHGTSHCVRYLTVLNESNFEAVKLQISIYHLCHLHMRATKSVSIVPPIYYAHLGAIRGQCYIDTKSTKEITMPQIHQSIKKSFFFI